MDNEESIIGLRVRHNFTNQFANRSNGQDYREGIVRAYHWNQHPSNTSCTIMIQWLDTNQLGYRI